MNNVKFTLLNNYCAVRDFPYQEISKPSQFMLVENQITGGFAGHSYGKAHAFIGYVEDAQVVGSGTLVFDEWIIAHGLSSGNYRANLMAQLKKYLVNGKWSFPEKQIIDDEAVLLWGCENFGHWLFTHLQRLTLLYHQPELFNKKILLWDKTPKRFLWWLERMGFENFLSAPDGAVIKKLWVPSVVTYRGHYEDNTPYIYPEAVQSIRHMILKDKAWIPQRNRERIYISRKNAKWRRLLNEEDVIRLMDSYGFTTVCLEDLSIEDQIDLISRASVIVMTAGGGSPTTMFAPPDCAIVEITNKAFIGTFASRCWAHVLGQRFERTDVKTVDNPKQIEDGVIGENLTSGLIGSLEIDKDGYVDILHLTHIVENL